MPVYSLIRFSSSDIPFLAHGYELQISQLPRLVQGDGVIDSRTEGVRDGVAMRFVERAEDRPHLRLEGLGKAPSHGSAADVRIVMRCGKPKADSVQCRKQLIVHDPAGMQSPMVL